MRHAAVAASRAGLFVFPLRTLTKVPVFHGETNCRGRGICSDGHRSWEQRATSDPDRVCRWWSREPFNVGIACGPSRLLVLDLDTSDGHGGGLAAPSGLDALAALANDRGETVSGTYTVLTPTGGQHRYFRLPGGAELRNTQGALAPRIDTRGGGGYVVGAGSALPGGRYSVVVPPPIAMLPEWIRRLLSQPARQPAHEGPAPTGPVSASYVTAIVAGEAAGVRAALVGTRQWTIYRAARTLGRLVGAGHLDEDVAASVVTDAAAVHVGVDGMTAAEVARAVRRGIAYGRRSPRLLGTASAMPGER
ncbi:bifunctional DNA primase/polymerase [Pseudonocardia sp. C8]|nr:bifunctional DNA primase/polymerase [Pseudonocardia sp. C8]MBC3191681.1 bifunctional DNA primase/polymerase [Pseudonocardia sp. C8]